MAEATERDDTIMGGVRTLFENADVLAVSKPEGLASIPERPRERASLLVTLEDRIGGKLYVVHRLDKGASGVIVFAKNPVSHRCINDQFARREVSKTYLALAHGILEEWRGTIDKPIRVYGSGRMGVDGKRGKKSETAYEVVRHVAGCTLVKAYPVTGRRHQVRVHFYSIGHPIVGDRRYGDVQIQKRFPRLMLHAQAIAFRLPTGESMTIEAPVPGSFQEVVDAVARG